MTIFGQTVVNIHLRRGRPLAALVILIGYYPRIFLKSMVNYCNLFKRVLNCFYHDVQLTI